MTLLQANVEAVQRHYVLPDSARAALAITAFLTSRGAGLPVSPGVIAGRPVFEGRLRALAESVGRMRGQLREVEIQADSQMQSRLSEVEERKGDYDPLEFDRYTRLQELTRLMVESLSDIASIQAALGKNLGETDAALLAQTRTTREVQQELMRMRAVPFSNLTERLHRVVRQAARELDKQAELQIEGAEVELDRSVKSRPYPESSA